jgi:hypothetical protein
MDYTRIVAVTGLPGLYEVLSSKSDGAIVRSLDDQSTKFVSSRIHNLSHLESIEVYTVRENVSLADVFIAMRDKKTKLPDTKENKSLRAYFEEVFPDLDFDRVYSSDMKKMIKWFEVLNANNIDFTAKPEPQQESESEAETVTAEEPKKKTARAKKEKDEDDEEEEEVKAPKKPAASKTAAAKKTTAAKKPAATKTAAKKTAAKKKAK